MHEAGVISGKMAREFNRNHKDHKENVQEAPEMEVEFNDDFEDRGIIFDDAKVINEAKRTQENTMERSFRKDARFPSVIEKHVESM